MNRIYRVVWNRARSQWMVASEAACSHARGSDQSTVVGTATAAGIQPTSDPTFIRLVAPQLLAALALAGGLCFSGDLRAQVATAGGNAAGQTPGMGYGDGFFPGLGSGEGGGNGGDGGYTGGSTSRGGGGGGAGSGGAGGATTVVGPPPSVQNGSDGAVNGGAGAERVDPLGGGVEAYGGGGGMGVRLGSGSLNIFAGAQIKAGNGGDGGDGDSTGGGGGGGGGHAVMIANGSLTNGGILTGGDGGDGGDSLVFGAGGHGGSGGYGVLLNGSMYNTGTITGGNGGFGGNDAASAPPIAQTFAQQGNGGEGVYVTSGSLRNAGSISGGLNAHGLTRANAVTFANGNATLILENGYSFTGNVVAHGGSNQLVLGGTSDGTFDVSNIGAAAQYRGFDIFRKIESGTWTLTGSSSQDWQVETG